MRPRILLIACAVTALAACSSSSLDMTKLETTLATELQSQLDLSAAPTVTCPEDVPIEKDNVFNCTAALDGETADIEVTQTDDQGNVSWEVVQTTS